MNGPQFVVSIKSGLLVWFYGRRCGDDTAGQCYIEELKLHVLKFFE